MVTLFVMSTTEGWIDVMWSGVDSVDIGFQPQINNRPLWIIFFISFIVVGSLFMLNLFVGVVINTFDQEKEKLGKNYMLTENEREWIQIQLLCYKSKPSKKLYLSDSKFRNFCIHIVRNTYFEVVIITCIFLNTVVLSLKWYGSPTSLDETLDIFNYIFAGIFGVEAIIKLIALKANYFIDGWNVFDFIIVCGTFIGIILT
jgi:hypothetical protein